MKEGWTYKKLGEVSSFQNGFAFKSSLFKKEGLPIVRISDIQDEQIKDDNLVMFKESDYNIKFDKYRIFPNDILIAMSGGTTGKLGINKTNKIFYQNQRVGVIRENDKLLNHFFLYYFLHTKSEESLKIAAGAAQPNLSTAQIKDFVIPLPPLSEQQQIVSYLDSSFAHIDELKANAEKQLNDAKALFQKTLEKAMEPKEGWKERKLKDVVNDNCPISYGIVQQGEHIDNGIPVVRPIDLNNIYVTRKNLKCTTIDISNSYKRTILNGNEILLSVRGTTGVVSMATPELKGCNVNRGIVPLSLKKEVDKLFIYYEMLSPLLQTTFAEKTTGSTLKQINIKDLRVIKIAYPPLSEQQQIVTRLDNLSANIKALEENLEKTISECDALKQAILRDVFE